MRAARTPAVALAPIRYLDGGAFGAERAVVVDGAIGVAQAECHTSVIASSGTPPTDRKVRRGVPRGMPWRGPGSGIRSGFRCADEGLPKPEMIVVPARRAPSGGTLGIGAAWDRIMRACTEQQVGHSENSPINGPGHVFASARPPATTTTAHANRELSGRGAPLAPARRSCPYRAARYRIG